jgi:TonB family protein
MENEGGHYEFYLFSGGREVFNSMMPMGEMESALNRMVRQRIKGVDQAAAQPFLCPAPEYPKALFRKKIGGTATVSFVIDTGGAVYGPTVVKASQPEFGEAALAAIRQWRFLPKVKGGYPVETRAEMPFEFAPPKSR